jgi:hypothetical protein
MQAMAFLRYRKLTACNRVLLVKLTVAQMVKKLAAFYGTRRFITVFTTARHEPYPEQDQVIPHTHTLFL